MRILYPMKWSPENGGIGLTVPFEDVDFPSIGQDATIWSAIIVSIENNILKLSAKGEMYKTDEP